MKKFLFAAAACLAFFGCKPDAPVAPEKVDNIQIAPEGRSVNNEGGEVKVLVTSSAEWTMTGKEAYDWVAADKSEGVDGDIVTFTVNPNEGEARLTAEFEFVCGTAKETFMLYSLPSDEKLTLTSDANVVAGYEAGRVEILVNSTLGYRGVSFTLTEGADQWFKHVVTLEGDTENDARIIFDVDALEGLADREAVVTIAGDNAPVLTVNVLQEAKHVLSLEKNAYSVPLEGESLVVPVTTNIAYDFEISYTNGYGWISASEKTEEGISLTVDALAEGSRKAIVVLTQTDAKEGEEALTAEFTVTQIGAIITWAAKMTNNRLFPKWEALGPGTCKTFTLETLIKFEDWNNISTVMGVEGQMLLRLGDNSPKNRLEIATNNGNYTVPFDFELNQWYHLAVTANYQPTGNSTYKYNWQAGYYTAYESNTEFKVYVDGELVGETTKTTWDFAENGFNLSPEWHYGEGEITRSFWMGYSYDGNRYLPGYMTEIRIWTKVLTAEEINAPNHFYEVDPDADGLFSYWKFTAGSGSSVPDATGWGNALYGELNVVKHAENDLNYGDAGIEWVEVALPEK